MSGGAFDCQHYDYAVINLAEDIERYIEKIDNIWTRASCSDETIDAFKNIIKLLKVAHAMAVKAEEILVITSYSTANQEEDTW